MVACHVARNAGLRPAHRALHAAWLAGALCALATLGVDPARADYRLDWYAMNGSGAVSMSGGPYTMNATLGQPEAGTLSGGVYSFSGGFWMGTLGQYTVGVGEEENNPSPLPFKLHFPAPNPCHDRTQVTFDLPREGPTTVRLYDVQGRLLRTLASGPLAAGRHRQSWDGSDQRGTPVAPGIYFLVLDSESMRTQQKIVVVR